jgi:drug/metabolite transporter (DMT)-like permease
MFLLLSALWGGSYLLIKVALDDDVSPWAVVAGRTALAVLALAPFALRLGVLGSLRGRIGPIVVLGLVQAAAPLTLIAVGEQYIASSLTGILVSSAPIFTFLLAFALSGAERAERGALAGVALGMVGVAMLLGVDAGGSSDAILGGLMIVLAALGYATGAWYLKRNISGVHPVATVTGTQFVALLATLPLGLIHLPSAVPTVEASISIFVLGVFCTGLGFVLFHSLVASEGPATASLVGYVAPGFSVLYGVTLLDESFTLATAAGLVLILGGSWLAAGGELPTRGRDVAPTGEPHGGADAALLEDVPEGGDRVAARTAEA